MENSREITTATELCSFCHNTPCQCPVELKAGQESLAGYGVTSEKSGLLSKDQTTMEKFANPWQPYRRAFGALPYFDKRPEIVAHFADEAIYFGKHYKTGQGPEWRDPLYAEGVLVFEMKFGKRLSEFAEEILAHYPDLKKQGKEISVFGLSGAGKSTALEALKEVVGPDAIVLDSDTVRFNLLAKMVKDVELAAGADLDEVRNQLIHNNISGALYFLLNHVTGELRERGYTVIRSSTQPTSGNDVTLYIEHPDGIDPRQITDEQIPAMAKELYNRTQSRVNGPDNYDWHHAETITNFNHMTNVTLQVPERVHEIFLKEVRTALEKGKDGSIRMLKNPKIDDPIERKQKMMEQLRHVV